MVAEFGTLTDNGPVVLSRHGLLEKVNEQIPGTSYETFLRWSEDFYNTLGIYRVVETSRIPLLAYQEYDTPELTFNVNTWLIERRFPVRNLTLEQAKIRAMQQLKNNMVVARDEGVTVVYDNENVLIATTNDAIQEMREAVEETADGSTLSVVTRSKTPLILTNALATNILNAQRLHRRQVLETEYNYVNAIQQAEDLNVLRTISLEF